MNKGVKVKSSEKLGGDEGDGGEDLESDGGGAVFSPSDGVGAVGGEGNIEGGSSAVVDGGRQSDGVASSQLGSSDGNLLGSARGKRELVNLANGDSHRLLAATGGDGSSGSRSNLGVASSSEGGGGEESNDGEGGEGFHFNTDRFAYLL